VVFENDGKKEKDSDSDNSHDSDSSASPGDKARKAEEMEKMSKRYYLFEKGT
jgi:hypothetical protein